MSEQERIHVKLAPWSEATQTLDLPSDATLKNALDRVGKPYSPISIRVGGKSVPETTRLIDGQVIATEVPQIIVG